LDGTIIFCLLLLLWQGLIVSYFEINLGIVLFCGISAWLELFVFDLITVRIHAHNDRHDAANSDHYKEGSEHKPHKPSDEVTT